MGDMLITNSLYAEAKLVRSAKSCDREHSEWFVLKPSTLFKGLGEGKKLNSVNCQISHCENQVLQVQTSTYFAARGWMRCLFAEIPICQLISLICFVTVSWMNTISLCIVCMWLRMQMHIKTQLVLWPLLCHDAPVPMSQLQALSQYQQAVFHRSMTEAHEIRAESTQNNHTELWDNPEPKHQKETGGHCFIYHPTRIHPEEKHWEEMHRLSNLAGTKKHPQKKQDVMSVYAWGDWWTTASPALKQKKFSVFVFCFIWGQTSV